MPTKLINFTAFVHDNVIIACDNLKPFEFWQNFRPQKTYQQNEQ